MKRYPLHDIHRQIIVQRLDIRLSNHEAITIASECHLCGKRSTGWDTKVPKRDVKDTRCPECGGIIVTRTIWDLLEED